MTVAKHGLNQKPGSVLNDSSTSHKASLSLSCMNVGHECQGRPFHLACLHVRSQFPTGSWYVIRPSCLVQPLYGSVAVPVTNSWPLRCVTSEKVEQESDWNGPKMMDGIIACCVVTVAVFQLASGLLSFPMKSNYTWTIDVCRTFEMILISVEWSRCLSSAGVVFLYLGCLCVNMGFIFILMFILRRRVCSLFLSFSLTASLHASVCVGICVTEQRQFWRRILEMDGLPKIF